MQKKCLWRVFSLCLTLVFLLALLPAVSAAGVVDSGECGAKGSSLTWSLDSSGTLTITGTGRMNNWADSLSTPWSSYSDRKSTRLNSSH